MGSRVIICDTSRSILSTKTRIKSWALLVLAKNIYHLVVKWTLISSIVHRSSSLVRRTLILIERPIFWTKDSIIIATEGATFGTFVCCCLTLRNHYPMLLENALVQTRNEIVIGLLFHVNLLDSSKVAVDGLVSWVLASW